MNGSDSERGTVHFFQQPHIISSPSDPVTIDVPPLVVPMNFDFNSKSTNDFISNFLSGNVHIQSPAGPAQPINSLTVPLENFSESPIQPEPTRPPKAESPLRAEPESPLGRPIEPKKHGYQPEVLHWPRTEATQRPKSEMTFRHQPETPYLRQIKSSQRVEPTTRPTRQPTRQPTMRSKPTRIFHLNVPSQNFIDPSLNRNRTTDRPIIFGERIRKPVPRPAKRSEAVGSLRGSLSPGKKVAIRPEEKKWFVAVPLFYVEPKSRRTPIRSSATLGNTSSLDIGTESIQNRKYTPLMLPDWPVQPQSDLIE